MEADLDPPQLQLGEEHGEADPTDRQQLIDQPLGVRGLRARPGEVAVREPRQGELPVLPPDLDAGEGLRPAARKR